MTKKHAKCGIGNSFEGGYNLSALGRSVKAHLRMLAMVWSGMADRYLFDSCLRFTLSS
jgi:acetoin utilization deacetylase AcuC-like enzyme